VVQIPRAHDGDHFGRQFRGLEVVGQLFLIEAVER
jgi:hypothetical protein